MALVARNLATEIDERDWLTVDQAARLTGDSPRTIRWRALNEAGDSRRSGRMPLARKAPSRDGRTKAVWLIHRRLDHRLSRNVSKPDRESRDRNVLLEKYPKHAIDGAYRKAHWLRRWDQLCQEHRLAGESELTLARRVVAEAKAVEAGQFTVSVRSLQIWRRAYNDTTPGGRIAGIAGLIDRRSLSGNRDGGATGSVEGRSPDAVEYFYGLYHCQSRPSAKTCHAATLRESNRQGWEWSVSYSATLKWLKVYDDRSVTCLMREGHDKWARKYMAHNEVDYSLIDPGALYVCDHTQLDCWCEHDGKQLRPWLTAIQDCRSRRIVGYHVGIAPHQDAIVAAMLMAFRECAIPERMRIDNGRDFTSRLLTGITKATRDRLRTEHGPDWHRVLKRDANLVECVDSRFMGIVPELGIELVYAIPYAPWSKGQLERWFRTYHDLCCKTFASYCGNSVLTKPECLEAIRRGYTKDQKRRLRKRYGRAWKKVAVLRFVDTRDVPTLDQVRAATAESIEVYHRSPHSADDMGGRTPFEVWGTATTLRRAEDRDLLFFMQSRGVYKVGPNGVGFRVGNRRLTYGAAAQELYRLRGRDVFITLDPSDLSHCYAWTPERANRRFIVRLDSNDRLSPAATVDDLREASATIERRRKIGRKAQREAPKRMRSVSQELTAQRREHVQELRATGTDGKPNANVKVVRTGFEGASKPVRTPSASGSARDLSAEREALGFVPPPPDPEPKQERATLDMIAGNVCLPKDGSEQKDGKDAEEPKSDLLSLIAGNRHERTNE